MKRQKTLVKQKKPSKNWTFLRLFKDLNLGPTD